MENHDIERITKRIMETKVKKKTTGARKGTATKKKILATDEAPVLKKRTKKEPVPEVKEQPIPEPEKEESTKPIKKITIKSAPGQSYYSILVDEKEGHVSSKIFTSSSNCKFMSVEYAGQFIDNIGAEYLNQLLNSTSREVMFLTVAYARYAEAIKKHCRVLYCIEVPIGYNETPQYHILIEREKGPYVNKVNEKGVTGFLRAATK